MNRPDLKTFRSMHTANFAQSRAIDRWLRIAQNDRDQHRLLKHPPMFNPIRGTGITYDQVLRKWFNQRNSAHKRGLQFALTPTSIMNMMRAKKCHYSGIELTPGAPPGKNTGSRISASTGLMPIWDMYPATSSRVAAR